MKLFTAIFLLLAPAYAAVPTPESHFGHKIGVDNELLDWDKVVCYFEALANSSDRIKFLELGKTVEGRPQIAAAISSPANHQEPGALSRNPDAAFRSAQDHGSRGGAAWSSKAR